MLLRFTFFSLWDVHISLRTKIYNLKVLFHCVREIYMKSNESVKRQEELFVESINLFVQLISNSEEIIYHNWRKEFKRKKWEQNRKENERKGKTKFGRIALWHLRIEISCDVINYFQFLYSANFVSPLFFCFIFLLYF